VRPPVLSRASEPLPVPIGTLDAIHLATALIWRDRLGPLPQMVTHDPALGAAARAARGDASAVTGLGDRCHWGPFRRPPPVPCTRIRAFAVGLSGR